MNGYYSSIYGDPLSAEYQKAMRGETDPFIYRGTPGILAKALPASPFWLVFNPARSMPKFQHRNEASAKTEADRLASLHPGEKFYVLKVTSLHTADKPKVTVEAFS